MIDILLSDTRLLLLYTSRVRQHRLSKLREGWGGGGGGLVNFATKMCTTRSACTNLHASGYHEANKFNGY